MFRETFARDPEEMNFPYLFHVHGNGGVGKSTLVRQWETAAREHASVVTAFVDDQVHDALEAMETVSARLSHQGHPLKKFDKQLAIYRQRRHQAESTAPTAQPAPGEPGRTEPAPPSPSSTVVAQVGLVGLGMLPGVGAFAGAVDPQQVALGADRMRALLNTRLRSHDDVQLVLNPLAALAPVFLEDLADVAERCERVVLFFDVYERTGPVLDAWLQSIVFREDHGSLPVNVQIVLSGQLRLDTRVWGDHLGDVTEVCLEVFTEEEARTLLATHGVTDEQRIELILRLSGRLPLLVDMLARSDTNSHDSIGDPSETAVERFLKWEPDEHRRQAALACALPLQLDEDTYRTIAPEAAEDGYPWLRGLAFVSHQAGRCRYHDMVRTQMLRLQRTQSPARWQQQHTRLADSFKQWRLTSETGLGTNPNEYGEDAARREHRLNESYHRLCAHPHTALPDALFQAVRAIDHDIATLRHWAQILSQAGHDTESPSLTSWGQRLATAVHQSRASINVLTLLLGAPELGNAGRALAHTARAREHRVAGDYERALADYAAALRITPDAARAYGSRGETYRLMGRYEEALSNHTRAIEINPQASWIFAARAQTYQTMERHDEAITDYTRAIEINPQYTWAIAARAHTYLMMKRYDDALSDYAQALELTPQADWAIAGRGESYRLMGRYEEALTEYTRATETNPQYAWAIGHRGETYRLIGRYEEALTDFNHAIEIDPQYVWAIASRALTYQAIQRYEDTLTGFNHAIEIDPRADWAIGYRGETYRLMGRYEEALTDFNHAIEIDPQYVWAIASRALTYRLMGRYEEALTDFNHIIETDPQADWAIAGRAATHLCLGRYVDAVIDCAHAVELNPEDGRNQRLYAVALSLTGSEEADTYFRAAIRSYASIAVGDSPKAMSARGDLLITYCTVPNWDRATAHCDAFLSAGPAPGLIPVVLEELSFFQELFPAMRPEINLIAQRLRDALGRQS
ncbi:tetratricopeptide repeat protein [Streptomyces sp. NPDC056831]|uniref:tetratricopeptide repeat protein n=1 Tax=Streptomyces sp. NPDC056831 TaxID=3345954 RepID=UPI0036AF5FE3